MSGSDYYKRWVENLIVTIRIKVIGIEYEWNDKKIEISRVWQYITIIDTNRNWIIVPHYNTKDTHKSLWVIYAPDNKCITPEAWMRKIAVHFGDKIH